MQIGPQDRTRHLRARLQHVVMVVPVDPDVDEAEDIAEEHRKDGPERAASAAPCGTFISSTMMVMMMAMTPSLKASSRCLLIGIPYADVVTAGFPRLGAGRRTASRISGLDFAAAWTRVPQSNAWIFARGATNTASQPAFRTSRPGRSMHRRPFRKTLQLRDVEITQSRRRPLARHRTGVGGRASCRASGELIKSGHASRPTVPPWSWLIPPVYRNAATPPGRRG